MIQITVRGAALAIAVFALCLPAQAQTMYRCGKQYQDRPCDGGQQGRSVGSATSSQPGVPATADAECARRGSDAMRIVWARETGATAEKLMSEIDAKPASPSLKAEEKSLVADVYRRRGTAPEMRAAIQSDCLAEKERQAQAAALAAAAARLQGQGAGFGAPTAAAPAAASEQDMRIADERQREMQGAREAERKKRTCASLNDSLERNRSALRAGGSGAAMDRLRERGRTIEGQMRDTGC
jgi:hypothetical protein